MTRALLLRSWRPLGYAAVAVGVMAFVLVARGAPWRGEWTWTFDWVAGASMILGPLYAGMAAFEAADGRPFDAAVARPTARRRALAVLAPLGGPTVAVLGAYLLGLLAATAVTAARSATDAAAPAMVALGVLLLLVFALAGLGVGQVLPRTVAGVSAWLGGLAITLASAPLSIPHLFRLGGVTGSLAGMGIRWPGVTTYAFAYVVLAALAYLVATGSWQSRVARARLWGLAMLLLIAVGIAARDDQLYEPLVAPQWRCAGSATTARACLLAGNTTQLPAWHHGLVRLTAALAATGATPVTTFRQPVPGGSVGRGEAVLSADALQVNIAPPTVAELARSVASPADCPQFRANTPPEAALTAQYWLADYLAAIADPRATAQLDPAVVHWMASTPQAAQRAWARSAYAKLRTCTFAGLDAPPGGQR